MLFPKAKHFFHKNQSETKVPFYNKMLCACFDNSLAKSSFPLFFFCYSFFFFMLYHFCVHTLAHRIIDSEHLTQANERLPYIIRSVFFLFLSGSLLIIFKRIINDNVYLTYHFYLCLYNIDRSFIVFIYIYNNCIHGELF